MNARKVAIAGEQKIRQMIERIAYQVAEENHKAKELVFIGIAPNGFHFAQKLSDATAAILGIPVVLHALKMNKANPEKETAQPLPPLSDLRGRAVILVDDVGNTGRTLFYALKPLLELHPSKLQVAVLVDRQHKQFPVSADFVGIALNTTLKEHIEVELDSPEPGIFLS